MTGPRSFREAFTEDPADVKDRARLVDERDSARDWAVVLENRIEKALALHTRKKRYQSANPWRPAASYVVCSHCTEGDYEAPFPCDTRAALTGGGDEPEQERSEDHAGQRVCPVCCAVPVGETDGCPCCEQWRNGIDTDGTWRVGGGDDARP